MPELVLASTSPYRKALLERLGLPFRCRAPQVDEEALKDEPIGPRALAERLALAKASSLRADEPGATLIGGDQLVSCRGRILGKPGSVEGAIDQLALLSGRTHELITALALWHEGQSYLHTDVTTLSMRPLERGEITRYVLADRPLDCAGSYRIEARGITLFDRIESCDHSAIVGMPLIALTTLLRELGFSVP